MPPSLNFSQLDFVRPSSGFHPVTWERISLGDYVLWFLGPICKHALKFQRWWFGLYRIHFFFTNNTDLLVTIDKFDPNPIFVNINKLKPYRFIEDKTLQPILIYLSDMVIDEHVQTKNLNHYLLKMQILNLWTD